MNIFRSLAVPVIAGVFAIGAMTAPLFAQVQPGPDPVPVPDCPERMACACMQVNCIGQNKRCGRTKVQCCCNPTGSTAGVCQCRLPDECANTTGEQCRT
jgi:hypothetical protein